MKTYFRLVTFHEESKPVIEAYESKCSKVKETINFINHQRETIQEFPEVNIFVADVNPIIVVPISSQKKTPFLLGIDQLTPAQSGQCQEEI